MPGVPAKHQGLHLQIQSFELMALWEMALQSLCSMQRISLRQGVQKELRLFQVSEIVGLVPATLHRAVLFRVSDAGHFASPARSFQHDFNAQHHECRCCEQSMGTGQLCGWIELLLRTPHRLAPS